MVSALAVDLVVLKLAFVYAAVGEFHLADALLHPLDEMTSVARVIWKVLNATTMRHVVEPVSFEAGTVRLDAASFTFHFVVDPDALVHGIVGGCELSSAIRHPILPLSDVEGFVSEDTQAESVPLLILPRTDVYSSGW